MSSREIYDGMDGVTTRTFKFRDPVVDNVCREFVKRSDACLLYTSPSPRDLSTSRMPSSA